MLHSGSIYCHLLTILLLSVLSRPGDTVVRKESLEPENLALWKEWATLAQSKGTPCIVQLAHPGRMSAKGSGMRPADMQSMCPSVVPVSAGGSESHQKVSTSFLPSHFQLQ